MSVRFDAFLSANTFKSPAPLGHLRKAFGFTQDASGRGETSVPFEAFLSVSPSNLPSPAGGRGAGGEGTLARADERSVICRMYPAEGAAFFRPCLLNLALLQKGKQK